MREDERLILRARQILDDPTLEPRQRVPNATALLKHLAQSMKGHPDQLVSLLSEISDLTVREQMRVAIEAENAG